MPFLGPHKLVREARRSRPHPFSYTNEATRCSTDSQNPFQLGAIKGPPHRADRRLQGTPRLAVRTLTRVAKPVLS